MKDLEQHRYYKLDENDNAIACSLSESFEFQMKNPRRRVFGKTYLNTGNEMQIEVSTIFTSINYGIAGHSEPYPQVFETLMTTNGHENIRQRYSTAISALNGHRDLVRQLVQAHRPMQIMEWLKDGVSSVEEVPDGQYQWKESQAYELPPTIVF